MLSIPKTASDLVDYGAQHVIVIPFNYASEVHQKLDDLLKNISLDIGWFISQTFFYRIYYRHSFTFIDFMRQTLAENVASYNLDTFKLITIENNISLISLVGNEIISNCSWFLDQIDNLGRLCKARPFFDPAKLINKNSLAITYWWEHDDEFNPIPI